MKKRILSTVLLVIGVLFVVSVIISFWQIRISVKKSCLWGKSRFGGSCVEAMKEAIMDPQVGIREKNAAVWTLGQLADKKALVLLKELRAGLAKQEQCDHDTRICFYEVEKAIRWCERGNATSWMYKSER